MQLLIQIESLDPSAWNAGAEDRANSGLTQMQVWRSAEGGTRGFALFQVNNPKAAKEWLAKEQGLGHSITAHWLETL